MLNAFTWTSIDKFGQQIIQFIIGVVLARILAPADYGLFGVLIIFIALSTVLIDGGFGQALIKKQDATVEDFSTIFYLNIFISIILYLLLFFLSPTISVFFHYPELTKILRVFSLIVFFYAAYFIQYVQLSKLLNFKSLAITNIICIVVGGTLGIALAYRGYGVWALVWQQLTSQIIRTILLIIIVRWKPAGKFSFRVISNFWNFSIHILGTSILNAVFNNIYNVLLGRFYSKETVGYYTQAGRYSDTVNSSLQQVLFSSTYPILVQIKDDKERLIRIHRRLVKSISLIFFPLIVTLIVTAQPLIITLVTEKWILSVLLFQLLLIANFFNPLYVLNINLLNSRGKSQYTFRLELIKKGLIIVSILICFSYGIQIMLIGYIAACFIAYFISILNVRKLLENKISSLFSDFMPGVLIGGVVGGAISIFRLFDMENTFLLITQLTVAFLLYLFLIRIIYPHLFSGALNYLLKKKKYFWGNMTKKRGIH